MKLSYGTFAKCVEKDEQEHTANYKGLVDTIKKIRDANLFMKNFLGKIQLKN